VNAGHSHGGGHGHDHAVPTGSGHRKPLAIVLTISITILIVEVIGAFVSGSLALLADAGHMLTDVAGLALALVAVTLASRPATDARTWGYRRAEVLAAAAQAAVLLAVGGFVLVEGVRRLIEPPVVASGIMIVFGIVGLLGNAVSVLLLLRIQSGNLNTRAALLEVVNDALGAAAVLVAAVVIALTGWYRVDAVASLLIGVLILPCTWKLLRETVDVLMEATPKGVDLADVRAHILAVDHVHDLHDVHASTVASDPAGAHRARRGRRLLLPRRAPIHPARPAAAMPGRALRRRALHLPVRTGRPRRTRTRHPRLNPTTRAAPERIR
jgi:cobalt-zinc-cadmium efflux system protein